MDGSWFCYVLQPTRPDILETGPTAEEAELGRHWQYTLGLHEEGRLAVAGRTTTGRHVRGHRRAGRGRGGRPHVDGGRPRRGQGLFQAGLHPFELFMLDGKLDP